MRRQWFSRVPALACSIVAVTLAACAASPPRASDDSEATTPDIETADVAAPATPRPAATPLATAPAVAPLAPLAELSQVCTNIGGVFQDGECLCPNVQVGSVSVRANFDARNGGSCARPTKAVTPCAQSGLERLLDEQGLGKLRACVETSMYGYKRAVLAFRLPESWTDKEEARPLARWLDQRLKESDTLYVKLSPAPNTTDSLQILFGAATLRRSDVQLSFSLPSIDPGASGVRTSRYLHVPSAEELEWALGNTGSAAPPQRSVAPPDSGELAAKIDAAIAQTHLEVNGSTPAETMLERCLGMCDVRQDYSLHAPSGERFSAWRVRRYQSGVVYRETIAVGDPSLHKVDGWVVLDLGGQPSLIFQINYGSSRLKPTVIGYDRNWKLLGSFDYDLLPDAASAAGAAFTAAPLHEGDAGVVLWDTGLTFDEGAIKDSLLLGRFTDETRATGSRLGWLDASPNDAVRYLDGVRTTVEGVLPFEPYPSLHGTGIAHLLLGHDHQPIRIVSMSLPSYVKEPEALAEVAGNSQIRVVNLSAFWPLDAEACKAHFPNGLDPRFLWVTGSGNSGREHTAQAPLARCPQTLPQHDNLLVVAGAQGDDAWPLSDVGSTYADLAADCNDDNNHCAGTSNAVPRVARTAALIVKNHPTLSIPMVRMSILLGVTVPDTAGPYRSGGFHDHDAALGIAGTLVAKHFAGNSKLTTDQAKEVLHSFYPFWNWSAADKKLATLTNNGTF